MRAITVSVEYDDILSITLPYNRHHFSAVMVVTSHDDKATQKVALENEAQVFCTDAFYDDGAHFNKWKALEQALDQFGRQDWLCLMDSDILWPKFIPPMYLEFGTLTTPQRYIHADPTQPVSLEQHWSKLPLFPEREFAGYSQIFHAEDPVLPAAPWHEVNWSHAGGADSFFQKLWADDKKKRPDWKVVHIGNPGSNWCGRATRRTDGTLPQHSAMRSSILSRLRAERRTNKNYDAEKITS